MYKLDDRVYNLGSLLGSGISGDVYRAEVTYTKEPDDTKKVAIKVVSKEFKGGEEVSILMKLQDSCEKYVLCYKDLFEDDDNYYIVTEYLEDYITLGELRMSFPSVDDIIEVIIDLIRGMEYLHERGIGHGDISENNIMVNKKNLTIKYIDFGLSHTDSDDTQKEDYKYLSVYIRRLISPHWGYYSSEEEEKSENKRIKDILSVINPVLIKGNKEIVYLTVDLDKMEKEGIPGTYYTD